MFFTKDIRSKTGKKCQPEILLFGQNNKRSFGLSPYGLQNEAGVCSRWKHCTEGQACCLSETCVIWDAGKVVIY